MSEQQPMFQDELSFLSNFDTVPFFVPQLEVDARSGEHAFNALKTLDPSSGCGCSLPQPRVLAGASVAG